MAFSISDWISKASLPTRSVVIFGRGDLVGEIEDLNRKLEVAEALEREDGTLAELSDANKIRQRLEEIWHEWNQSKTIWTVRALTAAETEKIQAENPVPTDVKAEDYKTRATKALELQGASLIAQAVVSVRSFNDEARGPVSAQTILDLAQAVGDLQVDRLADAVKSAQAENSAERIDAPK